MRVPFSNLAASAEEAREASLAALTRVYDSGRYILGSEVLAFENECRDWFAPGARCVGVSSGTDALVCALKALGMGPGHRVLTTPLTFFATVSAIGRVGATPVFTDVSETSYLAEPTMLRATAPDALLVVHLFGRVVDVEGWRRVLPQVPIVEDAAQAWGAGGADGPAGTLGEMGCFSFFPSKPLGACGDAGLVVTTDSSLETRCRALRAHGRSVVGSFDTIGGNYRIDEMQAALLRVRLKLARQWLLRRQNNARTYARELADLPEVVLPLADTQTSTSAWSVFSIRVPGQRDGLRQHLTERGVGTAVYYPTPVHLEPAFEGVWRPGEFPVAERLSLELLALPIGPELCANDLEYVCDAVRSFFRA